MKCEDAKFDRFRLHDLRYTNVSHAIMSGENLSLVGKLLGHWWHRTTAGYADLAEAHLLEAAEKVGSIIAREKKYISQTRRKRGKKKGYFAEPARSRTHNGGPGAPRMAPH